MRAAVAEVLAEPEPAARPDAGGGPAVPERFAATVRFLANPLMVAPELPDKLVARAVATLAADCGYRFVEMLVVPTREAPAIKAPEAP